MIKEKEINCIIWVKASERMPDTPDYWLANNKIQSGRIVFCKVNGRKGIGYFYRSENKIYFSYTFYCHSLSSTDTRFWQPMDYWCIDYDEFDLIEWLDESN